ncbi:odorant receptor 131-2-like [Megalops cyprinoides]|uniref:odorant receptor 131-2-like n=1 Tax=Megalops cyprinoides TaxID=118141 RepID=UPI0018651677|nr:odorant receptor 131-2-like [Megalops cyprinoides]
MDEANFSVEEPSFIYQQAYHIQLDGLLITRMVIVLSTSLFFFYVNSIMFFTLRSKPVFRETSRYILFANIVFSDSILLLSNTVIYSYAVAYLYVFKAVCALVMLFCITTYTFSPLNLAVMSLERYVAICYPLHHAEITTQKRTNITIGVVWFLASLNIVIDLFYTTVTKPHSFNAPTFCTRERLLIDKWQLDLFHGLNGFYFVTVAVIIIYTYIAIIVAAKSVSTDKDSAKKARNTVLLHLIQLGLCLTSFLYGVFEHMLSTIDLTLYLNIRVLLFFVLIILPRCLSPLIYGLRDDIFRPLFLSYFRCRYGNIKPAVILYFTK